MYGQASGERLRRGLGFESGCAQLGQRDQVKVSRLAVAGPNGSSHLHERNRVTSSKAAQTTEKRRGHHFGDGASPRAPIMTEAFHVRFGFLAQRGINCGTADAPALGLADTVLVEQYESQQPESADASEQVGDLRRLALAEGSSACLGDEYRVARQVAQINDSRPEHLSEARG